MALDSEFAMSTLLLTSLGIVCPSCEVLNPVATLTCQSCSTPLTTGARPAAKDTVPPGLRPTLKPGVLKPEAPTKSEPLRPEGLKPPVLKPEAPTRPEMAGTSPPVIAPAPAPAHTPPPRAATKPGPWLVAVVEGSAKGQSFKMPSSGAAVIGRHRGVLAFTDDPHVSPQHAVFMLREGQVVVRDENSTSGIFVSIRRDVSLPTKGMFIAGDRLFRFFGAVEKPKAPAPGRPWPYGAPTPADILYLLEELLMGHRPGRTAISAGPLLCVGQAGCDLSYPGDPKLASKHCELAVGPSGAILRDTSGTLGTFVRIAPGADHPLQQGDRVRVGGQILQIGS